MSLISDTDFLIHSSRLLYLREVEDLYGSRIITLDPSFNSNPYITAASLADPERWPELAAPVSPELSEDEHEKPPGQGARLKYTQTIMGGRTGGLGLRVNAKRLSTSKRLSGTPRPSEVKNFLSANAPVQEALSTTAPATTSIAAELGWERVAVTDGSASNSQPTLQVQEPSIVEEAPVAKVVQFIPKFKGAAEMEARRRQRMAARRGPVGALPRAAPQPILDFDSSSDEEAIILEDSCSSDEFGVDVHESSMDDGDEFDPDFAATRASLSDNASDGISVFSGGSNSVLTSSNIISSSQTNNRSRARLNPVSEKARTSGANQRRHSTEQSFDSLFEMVTPAPGPSKQDTEPHKPGDTQTHHHHHHHHHHAHHRKPNLAITTSPSLSTTSAEALFGRKKVAAIKPLKSALSSMLASSSGTTNPFAKTYAAISGRGESASTNVQVYFPHARQPIGKAMDLNIRKDATVEEVLGFALWTYWEDGWLPKINDGLSSDEDPKWKTKVSAIGWILRIAEDDGEVDDDFPPPDRMGKITKFNSSAYAVLEATTSQIQQNQILESKIQRRPSRTTVTKNDRLAVPGSTIPVAGSANIGSTLGSVPLSTSLGPSSGFGPQIFLRIRVADTADAVHISTTIPVSAGMYMQEALELVCRKRKLANPNDYALLLADKSILIPLDRTVASLQGKRELLLVKRSMLPEFGEGIVKGIGRTTDPNASIFNRMSDTPEQKFSSALDYTIAYKKYTIYRKMPMLVTRQARTLAFDGVYIHIMPSANKAKAVFDNGKTSSYHIKSIADCQQSAKSSSTFKLVLSRGTGNTNKRYDFEAESPKMAAEIVQMVKGLKAALERSGTVNKSRRSRQVV